MNDVGVCVCPGHPRRAYVRALCGKKAAFNAIPVVYTKYTIPNTSNAMLLQYLYGQKPTRIFELPWIFCKLCQPWHIRTQFVLFFCCCCCTNASHALCKRIGVQLYMLMLFAVLV